MNPEFELSDENKNEFEEIEIEEEDEEVALIPFHAINEFMRSDFRLRVLRRAYQALPSLAPELRQPVEQFVRHSVQVPGFRNSLKAPAQVKASHTVKAFEDHPELVAAILAAWSEANPELRQNVYDLLVEREWDVLPIEADRANLPGFMIEWPGEEDFETLVKAYQEKYPEAKDDSDDISLMVVWVAMRLPYHKK